MQRRFIDYFVISLKGLAMGAADVVPGVSGGTIAFISGIYEELITSLNNISFSLFKTLKMMVKIYLEPIKWQFLISPFYRYWY